MAGNKVLPDIGYYPDPITGRPLYNAKIYVGIVDLKPAGIPANQVAVSVLQENGSTIPIAQPIRTDASGQPTYQGSTVTLVTDSKYSLQVLTADDVQVSYSPNVVNFASANTQVIAGAQLLGGGDLSSDVTLDFDYESPDFTGEPTAPTQPQGTSNKTIATTEFVMTANANVGQVSQFASSNVPAGWVECDGSALSRDTYADLFAVIGTIWGAGDGSTTFNIPDMRGIISRGWDNGAGVDIGREIGTYQDESIGPHNHLTLANVAISGTDNNLTSDNYVARQNTWGHNDPTYALRGTDTAATVGKTALSGGVENRMANAALMFCIKVSFGSGDGGGVTPVNSVTADPGCVVGGTNANPSVGTDYTVTTVTPTDVGSTTNGHIWYVVPA